MMPHTYTPRFKVKTGPGQRSNMVPSLRSKLIHTHSQGQGVIHSAILGQNLFTLGLPGLGPTYYTLGFKAAVKQLELMTVIVII